MRRERTRTNPQGVPSPTTEKAPTWRRAVKWAAGVLVGGAGIIVTATVTVQARPTRAEVQDIVAPLEKRQDVCESRIGWLERSVVEITTNQRWEIQAIDALVRHAGLVVPPPPPPSKN